jgi:gamma-glutamylcyclotransferase (GGCT)/AIG2-like uncharacterized protein YtfP
MPVIRYFAYGSNMLSARLQGRCPSACACGIARVEGFELQFTKRSQDGSGKATIIAAGMPGARAYGVLFELDAADLTRLDQLEGVGRGYRREDAFEVVMGPEAQQLRVTTYIADLGWIDGSLRPYDWYLRLVLKGAQQHRLPPPYLEFLGATAAIADPTPDRKARIEALELLAQLGVP